LTTDNGLMQTT